MNPDWEQIGTFGVDAGIVWIGDPCYCVTPDANSHPAKTWQEFCDILSRNDFNDHNYMQFNYGGINGRPGLGVCVSTGYGDGEYPVFIKKNKEGRVMQVLIDFNSNGEEEMFNDLLERNIR